MKSPPPRFTILPHLHLQPSRCIHVAFVAPGMVMELARARQEL